MSPRFLARPSRATSVNLFIGFAVLLVVALVVRTVSAGNASTSSSAVTATVDTGDVTATVSATGNVDSAHSVEVDFTGSGGVVKAIYVKVGDRVHRGQPLARVDQTSARQGLRTALATLASARAAYLTTTQGQTTQERARDQQSVNVSTRTVASARVSLRAARQTLALDRAQQNSAVARAEQALSEAKADRDKAQQQYQADPTATYQQALTDARAAVQSDQSALTTAQDTRASRLLADRQAVASQAANQRSAQAQLHSTQATVQVDQQPPRQGAVDSAAAQIASAQVTVDQACTTLQQTILRAPTRGTVASINGVVGQTSSSAASSSASSSSSATSSSTSSSSSGTSGSSGFLTLSSLGALQVKADVAEADISEVRVGQSATVTLSANDRQLTGTVTDIDTVQTVTNNVVEYGVTVTLARHAGVKLGQTSQVVITTGSKQNVTRVSSSTLTTIGNQTTATVQNKDGSTRTVMVTTGLKGDSETEVLSGLSAGDVVVLPQQTTGSGSFTFPGAGVGRGLGGTP
ncbi:MAG: HlyD family efflux transporter periplasmic adaptor subunit [Nocardioides sp.]